MKKYLIKFKIGNKDKSIYKIAASKDSAIFKFNLDYIDVSSKISNIECLEELDYQLLNNQRIIEEISGTFNENLDERDIFISLANLYHSEEWKSYYKSKYGYYGYIN